MADEQQVLQVGVEQGGVDHGDAQPLLHDEPHRAVVWETDLCRRPLKLGAAGRKTIVFLVTVEANLSIGGDKRENVPKRIIKAG